MLAAELGRPVTNVADADLAQQARGLLEQAGICAKPGAILRFSVDVAREYEMSPCSLGQLIARRKLTACPSKRRLVTWLGRRA